MVMIEVEKYSDDIRVQRFRVPAGLVAVLARFLPKAAREQLRLSGLPLEDILHAAGSRRGSSHWLDADEKGMARKIRISVV